MKTITTVLNEREGAEHRWPGQGFLTANRWNWTPGYVHPQGRPADYYEHCCIGAHGLACGVPSDMMKSLAMPPSVTLRGSDLLREDSPARHIKKWQQAWDLWVPEDLVREIENLRFPNDVKLEHQRVGALLGDIHPAEDGPHAGTFKATDVAVELNDHDDLYPSTGQRLSDHHRDARDKTVAALRLLFRHMGEQRGERWIIRHLK